MNSWQIEREYDGIKYVGFSPDYHFANGPLPSVDFCNEENMNPVVIKEKEQEKFLQKLWNDSRSMSKRDVASGFWTSLIGCCPDVQTHSCPDCTPLDIDDGSCVVQWGEGDVIFDSERIFKFVDNQDYYDGGCQVSPVVFSKNMTDFNTACRNYPTILGYYAPPHGCDSNDTEWSIYLVTYKEVFREYIHENDDDAEDEEWVFSPFPESMAYVTISQNYSSSVVICERNTSNSIREVVLDIFAVCMCIMLCFSFLLTILLILYELWRCVDYSTVVYVGGVCNYREQFSRSKIFSSGLIKSLLELVGKPVKGLILIIIWLSLYQNPLLRNVIMLSIELVIDPLISGFGLFSVWELFDDLKQNEKKRTEYHSEIVGNVLDISELVEDFFVLLVTLFIVFLNVDFAFATFLLCGSFLLTLDNVVLKVLNEILNVEYDSEGGNLAKIEERLYKFFSERTRILRSILTIVSAVFILASIISHFFAFSVVFYAGVLIFIQFMVPGIYLNWQDTMPEGPNLGATKTSGTSVETYFTIMEFVVLPLIAFADLFVRLRDIFPEHPKRNDFVYNEFCLMSFCEIYCCSFNFNKQKIFPKSYNDNNDDHDDDDEKNPNKSKNTFYSCCCFDYGNYWVVFSSWLYLLFYYLLSYTNLRYNFASPIGMRPGTEIWVVIVSYCGLFHPHIASFFVMIISILCSPLIIAFQYFCCREEKMDETPSK